MKYTYFLFIFFIGFAAIAQDQDSNYKTKTVAVQESIAIDSVSINSAYFSIKRKDNTIIDSTLSYKYLFTIKSQNILKI